MVITVQIKLFIHYEILSNIVTVLDVINHEQTAIYTLQTHRFR